MGGLSGRPIFGRAINLTKTIHSEFKDLPIIFSGGVFTPEHALEALDSGASLVEVYTGFIYNGPTLLESINRYLSEQQLINNFRKV
jgi:Dihydroorotate dehydrogenase